MGDSTKYPLADLIEALALELREAHKRSSEKLDADTFDLDSATVELAIGWETNKKGVINFQVFKMGGGITRNNTSTLTVTIRPSGAQQAAAAQQSGKPMDFGVAVTAKPKGYPVGDTSAGPRASVKPSR